MWVDKARRKWAIVCIGHDGESDFVCHGITDRVALFKSRADAQQQADFLKMGVDDEYQSINVVLYGERVAPAARKDGR